MYTKKICIKDTVMVSIQRKFNISIPQSLYEIKIASSNKAYEKKAPFHNSKNNMADSLLIETFFHNIDDSLLWISTVTYHLHKLHRVHHLCLPPFCLGSGVPDICVGNIFFISEISEQTSFRS